MISESLAFKILAIMGCWLNTDERIGRFRKNLYWFYSSFVVLSIWLLFTLQIIYVIINIKNNLHLVIFENTTMIVGFFFTSWKTKLLIFDRNKILNLDNLLQDSVLTAKSSQEILILKSCSKLTKFTTSMFTFVIEVCIVFWCILPLLSQEIEELPLKHWIPFKLNRFSYWMIYTWHFIVLFTGAALDSCSDCIFVDFIEYGCANLKILSFRLQAMIEIMKSAWQKK